MCMQTKFGGMVDKSYIIRDNKKCKEVKEFDFDKLSKPDPDFVDERIKMKEKK